MARLNSLLRETLGSDLTRHAPTLLAFAYWLGGVPAKDVFHTLRPNAVSRLVLFKVVQQLRHPHRIGVERQTSDQRGAISVRSVAPMWPSSRREEVRSLILPGGVRQRVSDLEPGDTVEAGTEQRTGALAQSGQMQVQLAGPIPRTCPAVGCPRRTTWRQQRLEIGGTTSTNGRSSC